MKDKKIHLGGKYFLTQDQYDKLLACEDNTVRKHLLREYFRDLPEKTLEELSKLKRPDRKIKKKLLGRPEEFTEDIQHLANLKQKRDDMEVLEKHMSDEVSVLKERIQRHMQAKAEIADWTTDNLSMISQIQIDYSEMDAETIVKMAFDLMKLHEMATMDHNSGDGKDDVSINARNFFVNLNQSLSTSNNKDDELEGEIIDLKVEDE